MTFVWMQMKQRCPRDMHTGPESTDGHGPRIDTGVHGSGELGVQRASIESTELRQNP